MSAQDAPVPLRVRVNLIPVRVVVRDTQGHAVANLHKEDFQLFQDGKPQEISNFAVRRWTLSPDTLSSRRQYPPEVPANLNPQLSCRPRASWRFYSTIRTSIWKT